MKATHILPHELDGALVRRWEELRDENSAYASPFYSPEFTRAVGNARRDARITIFERSGRIVGFLPHHRLRGRIAKPIGGHLNDYHGAILTRGLGLSEPGLLASAGLDAYDFDHLPASFGGGATITDSSEFSPQMNLADGFDGSAATQTDSWRRAQKGMARKRRKMEREVGPIRFEFHCGDDELFDRHIALRNALYRRMGQRADYCSGWHGEVLQSLRKSSSGEFRSTLNVLFAGSRPVAMHFGLISRGVMHWWFPSYDLSDHQYSPGVQLIEQCARSAVDNGISLIDFGKGDDRYKLQFADRAVPLLKGSVCRSGSLASRARSGSARLLNLAERVLPTPIRPYPRKSIERLWTGTMLPRHG